MDMLAAMKRALAAIETLEEKVAALEAKQEKCACNEPPKKAAKKG